MKSIKVTIRHEIKSPTNQSINQSINFLLICSANIFIWYMGAIPTSNNDWPAYTIDFAAMKKTSISIRDIYFFISVIERNSQIGVAEW